MWRCRFEFAVSGDADYLVSGNADLLALNPFQGVRILPPHSFLEISYPDVP
jgi:predicted nucleic acid-binding protein